MFKIVEDNFDDILFENKERAYGAFQLRKNYSRNVALGGAISFGTVIITILTYFFWPEANKVDDGKIDSSQIIVKEFDLNAPPLPKQLLKPNFTKKGNPKITKKPTKPKVVKQEEKVTEVKVDEDNSNKTSVTDTTQSGNSSEGNDKKSSDGNTTDSTAIGQVQDTLGGLSEFVSYVQKNVKYPEYAVRNNVSGTVFVYFLVNEKGAIEDIKITKKLGFGIDEEVMRVILAAPKWRPNVINGEAKKQRIHVPIKLTIPKT